MGKASPQFPLELLEAVARELYMTPGLYSPEGRNAWPTGTRRPTDMNDEAVRGLFQHALPEARRRDRIARDGSV